jgi:hypothetical protein
MFLIVTPAQPSRTPHVGCECRTTPQNRRCGAVMGYGMWWRNIGAINR